MKKLVVLLTAVLLCLSGMARNLADDWVVTKDGKIDCKKVSLGYNKARVVLEDGQKELVQFKSINSFSMNGKIFAKLPLYNEGKPTGAGAFMELIKAQGELSLYKFGFRSFDSADPLEITYRYYLYQGNKLYLELNEKTLANICLHFGVDQDAL